MTDLFQNKYRIPSARLKSYDYAGEGMYFVTICTKFMQHFFGKIINDPVTKITKLQPTEIGRIAESEWHKSLEIRPDMNLDIGEFIVMPNHIHGIIIIGKNEFNSGEMKSELNANWELNRNSESHRSTDAMHRVSTQSTPQSTPKSMQSAMQSTPQSMQSATQFMPQSMQSAMQSIPQSQSQSIPQSQSAPKNAFAPQSKNLASIMRGYKSAVTTYARKNNIKFEWHVRYHDHIIRNEAEYLRISNYIKNNPSKWLDDKFNNSK